MSQSFNKHLEKVDSINKVLDDSLQCAESEKKVIGYKTNFSYRRTNAPCAIVLMSQNVELDKNLKVISIISYLFFLSYFTVNFVFGNFVNLFHKTVGRYY